MATRSYLILLGCACCCLFTTSVTAQTDPYNTYKRFQRFTQPYSSSPFAGWFSEVGPGRSIVTANYPMNKARTGAGIRGLCSVNPYCRAAVGAATVAGIALPLFQDGDTWVLNPDGTYREPPPQAPDSPFDDHYSPGVIFEVAGTDYYGLGAAQAAAPGHFGFAEFVARHRYTDLCPNEEFDLIAFPGSYQPGHYSFVPTDRVWFYTRCYGGNGSGMSILARVRCAPGSGPLSYEGGKTWNCPGAVPPELPESDGVEQLTADELIEQLLAAARAGNQQQVEQLLQDNAPHHLTDEQIADLVGAINSQAINNIVNNDFRRYREGDVHFVDWGSITFADGETITNTQHVEYHNGQLVNPDSTPYESPPEEEPPTLDDVNLPTSEHDLSTVTPVTFSVSKTCPTINISWSIPTAGTVNKSIDLSPICNMYSVVSPLVIAFVYAFV